MQSFSLFPPILENQSPAVKWKENPAFGGHDVVAIQFKLSEYAVFDDIGHVQVSIREKTTNNIAVNVNSSPDQQVLYIQVRDAPQWSSISNPEDKIDMLEYNEETHICTLRIPFICFENGNLQPNTEYNIQIRFGLSNLWCNTNSLAQGNRYEHSAIDPTQSNNYGWNLFHAWYANQANESHFGEWSNVTTVFCYQNGSLNLSLAKNSFIPEFICQYSNASDEDALEKIAVNYSYIYNGEQIEKSFIINHSLNNMIKFSLPIAHIVKLNNLTVKGYTSKNVQLEKAYIDQNENVFTMNNTLALQDITNSLTEEEKEDGVLYLKYSAAQDHAYEIYRINVQSLETIQLMSGYILNDNSITIKDFSVEMGEDYVYAAVNPSNLTYVPRYCRLMKMDSILLTTKKHQLRLIGNTKLSGFKRNVSEGFQTTIGGQYPFYSRFSNINYRTFNFEGLITILFDPTFTFFVNDGEYGLRWQDNDHLVILNRDLYKMVEYSINSRRVQNNTVKNLDTLNPDDVSGPLTIYDNYLRTHRQWFNDTSYSDEMIYTERKFREYVMNWLSDGKPKLFRSETEGNMIVMLTGINFTPYDASGRMVYQMSATATEIAEYNTENLLKYDLLPIEITTFTYENLEEKIDPYLPNVLFAQGATVLGGSGIYVYARYTTDLEDNENALTPLFVKDPPMTVEEYCELRNRQVENGSYELYCQQPLLFNLLLYGTYNSLLSCFENSVVTLHDIILYYQNHKEENNNIMENMRLLLARLIRNYVLDIDMFPELELMASTASFLNLTVNLTYWQLFQKFGFNVSLFTLRNHLTELAQATPELGSEDESKLQIQIANVKSLIDQYLDNTGTGDFPFDETVSTAIWKDNDTSFANVDVVVWDRYKTGNMFTSFYQKIQFTTTALDSNIGLENNLEQSE